MTRQEIGAKIKEFRTEKGISKYSVVKKTGLTFQQLGTIEAGSKNYTIDSLSLYLGALGMKMELK